MQDATVTFEQPLNEYIRVCLRLEHLFEQTARNIQSESEWECRIALLSLLEALNVTDRPDLKSKFSKALSQHASVLAQLEQKPQVDREKLQEILNELDQLVQSLYKTQDKMGHNLRSNGFLNTIRQHMANPGGPTPFSTPAYHLWLQQPVETRNQDLSNWFDEFEQLRAAVKLLLQLTRGSANPQPIVALQGFYQQALDANMPCHLVRVTVPVDVTVYPEISVGRHRLSVRFLKLNTADRANQAVDDIKFHLSCCMPMVPIG